MTREKILRKTQQRQVIIEELLRHESHPTASQLYDVVKQRLPRISLGTVYRNLELLARSRVIRKLEFGGAETRFDANNGFHYHVRCSSCGRIDDVPDPPPDLVGKQPKMLGDYQITGHRLEFIGICPACRDQ